MQRAGEGFDRSVSKEVFERKPTVHFNKHGRLPPDKRKLLEPQVLLHRVCRYENGGTPGEYQLTHQRFLS